MDCPISANHPPPRLKATPFGVAFFIFCKIFDEFGGKGRNVSRRQDAGGGPEYARDKLCACQFTLLMDEKTKLSVTYRTLKDTFFVNQLLIQIQVAFSQRSLFHSHHPSLYSLFGHFEHSSKVVSA